MGGTPLEVASGSTVVFSMVGFPDDVREVILGPEGALQGARPGTILIDMTTSEPSLALEIARRRRQKVCTRSMHQSRAATSAPATPPFR